MKEASSQQEAIFRRTVMFQCAVFITQSVYAVSLLCVEGYKVVSIKVTGGVL